MVTIFNTSSYRAGGAVNLRFTLSQHSRDQILLESLTQYFSCGRFKLHPNRDTGEFMVTDLSSIVNIIIPFFKKYPIDGVKALDFEDFCRIATIMELKGHLTKSGLDEIRSLKGRMNTLRGLILKISNFILTVQGPAPWGGNFLLLRLNKLSGTPSTLPPPPFSLFPPPTWNKI